MDIFLWVHTGQTEAGLDVNLAARGSCLAISTEYEAFRKQSPVCSKKCYTK